MNKPSDELLSICEYLVDGDQILFFPDPLVINSVFMFNERMFLPKDVSMINTVMDNVHLLSTVSLLDSNPFERNEMATEMLTYYKNISPLFQMCGNSTNQVSCVREFSDKFGFNKALVHKNNPFASIFKREAFFGNYFLVNLGK